MWRAEILAIAGVGGPAEDKERDRHVHWVRGRSAGCAPGPWPGNSAGVLEATGGLGNEE